MFMFTRVNVRSISIFLHVFNTEKEWFTKSVLTVFLSYLFNKIFNTNRYHKTYRYYIDL